MAIFGALNALLSVDNKQWKQGFSEARGEVNTTKEKLDDLFKNIKSNFGRRSLFGESLEIAAGRGAITALTDGTKEITEFADKLAAMRAEVESGQKTVKEAITDGVREVPVLGSFVKMWDAVGGAITGETAAAEENNSVAEIRNKILDESAAALKRAAKANEDYMKIINDEFQSNRTSLMISGLHAGLEQETAKLKDKYDKLIQGEREALKKVVNDPEINRLKEALRVSMEEDKDAPGVSEKISTLKQQLQQAMQFKQQATEKELQVEGQLQEQYQQEQNKENLKAGADMLKKQTEIRIASNKEINRKLKEDLEQKIDTLQQLADKSEDHAKAVETKSIRGNQTVLLGPETNSLHKQQVVELKKVNEQLKSLNIAIAKSGDNDSQDVFVGF